MKTYTVELIEDGDDLILPFPQEVLDTLGWKEDDILTWEIQNDTRKVILSKKDTND